MGLKARGPGASAPGKDFFFEVAKGNIAGHAALHKFGLNADIDAASGFEAIWNGGGDYTGHNATAAEVVTVVSGSVADAAAGTGARTVQIFGLDASYEEQSETVTLNGTTAVDSANSYIRLDRAVVLTAGSGGVNAGAITIAQKVTTANVFVVMPAGYNATMIAATTIPANKVGYLAGWFATMAKAAAGAIFANVRLVVTPFGETAQVKEEMVLASTGTSGMRREYRVPKAADMTAKADVVITADVDGDDSSVAASFDLILVDTD